MGNGGVLIVEDDAPTRERLARVLAGDPALRLIAAVGSCAEAHRQLAAAAPEVLMVDLGLPDGSGIEIIRAAAANPAILCIVISVFGDEAHVIEAIEAGATGYLLKDATAAEICKALADLRAGGSPISPSVARHLLNRYRPKVRIEESASSVEFTEREAEVLRLVAKGLAYAEIGQLLSITVHTVGHHVKQLYRKLAVHSRGEAVFEAQQRGLLGRLT